MVMAPRWRCEMLSGDDNPESVGEVEGIRYFDGYSLRSVARIAVKAAVVADSGAWEAGVREGIMFGVMRTRDGGLP